MKRKDNPRRTVKYENHCNKQKAYHDYFVEDTYEAGIVLVGTEVKSVRLGAVNLRDSFAIIKTARCLW